MNNGSIFKTVNGGEDVPVEHDDAGNLTKDHRGCSYEYDYENRLTRVYLDTDSSGSFNAGDTGIAQFEYDALGRRIEKKNSQSNTASRYYYDDQRVVLRTAVNSSGVESDNRSFVFGNYIDEVLIMRNGATTYYYAHDHLYSPAALFSSSGAVLERYEYDAYGKAAILSANYEPRTMSLYANAYYFTGRELDVLDSGSLKIMYYRARSYDPQTGRFMQRDPLGIDPAGGNRNPFSILKQYTDGMNSYGYATINPVLLLDSSGLVACTYTGTFDVLMSAPLSPLNDNSDIYVGWFYDHSEGAWTIDWSPMSCASSGANIFSITSCNHHTSGWYLLNDTTAEKHEKRHEQLSIIEFDKAVSKVNELASKCTCITCCSVSKVECYMQAAGLNVWARELSADHAHAQWDCITYPKGELRDRRCGQMHDYAEDFVQMLDRAKRLERECDKMK